MLRIMQSFMTHGGDMTRLINLAVSTFTIFCILFTFSIAWIILGALRVPEVLAFIASLAYSGIPIYIFIREEMLEFHMKGQSNVNLLSNDSVPAGSNADGSPDSKVRRGRKPKRIEASAV